MVKKILLFLLICSTAHAQWGSRPFSTPIILKNDGELVEGNGRILDMRNNIGVTWDSIESKYHITTDTDPFTADSLTLTGDLDVDGKITLGTDDMAVRPSVTFTVCAYNALSAESCDYFCDGVNDEVQFEAAFAAAPAAGSKIAASEGIFTIGSPITFTDQGVWLDGSGPTTTTFNLADGANCNMFEIDVDSVKSGMRLRNFTVNGNHENNTSTSWFIYDGVGSEYIGGIVFDDLVIKEFNDGGIWLNTAHNSIIRNCTIQNNEGYGIQILGGVNWKISDNIITSNINGIKMEGVVGKASISGNTINAGQDGVGIYAGSGTSTTLISQNLIYDQTGTTGSKGIHVVDSANTYMNNFIWDAASILSPCVQIDSGTGNEFWNNNIDCSNGTDWVDNGTNTSWIDIGGSLGRTLFLGQDNFTFGATAVSVDSLSNYIASFGAGNIAFGNGEALYLLSDDVYQFRADGSSGSADAEIYTIDMTTQGTTLLDSSNYIVTLPDYYQYTVGGVEYQDDVELAMGAGSDLRMHYYSGVVQPTIQIGLRGYSDWNYSGIMSLMEDSDMGHANRNPAANNGQPTFRWYKTGTDSSLDWFDIYNDGDAQLKTGAGDIILTPDGGDVDVTGILNVSSDLNVTSDSRVTGDSLITGDEYIGGDLDITGSLVVDTKASIGTADTTEVLNVGGNIQLANGEVIQTTDVDDQFALEADGSSGSADAETVTFNFATNGETHVTTSNAIWYQDRFTIFNAGSRHKDDDVLQLGTGADAVFKYVNGSLAQPSLQLGLRGYTGYNFSGIFSIVEDSDMGHANRMPAASNNQPTIRWYKTGTDSSTDWFNIYFDDDAQLVTGAGGINLNPASGTATVTGSDEKVCGATNAECIDFDDGSDGQIDLKGVGGTNNLALRMDFETSADSVVFSLPVTGDSFEFIGRVRQTKIWHAYGGYMDEAYTLPCDADTWRLVTNADNTLWTGLELDGISFTDDQMTIANSGDYAGTVTLTISALNGKDFHLRIYNETQSRVEGFALGISTTGAGNEMSLSMPAYLEITAGDVLSIQINSKDGTDPILDDGLFYLYYLHD